MVYFFVHNLLLFLYSIKLFRYKKGINFDKDPLVVEQNNYPTKISNAYIVYNLDAWPEISISNVKFKNNSFGATKRVKNSDKVNSMYSGYRKAFHGVGLWNVGNDIVLMIML